MKPDNERVLNKSLVTEKFYLERIVNNRKITALKKKKAGMDNKKKIKADDIRLSKVSWEIKHLKIIPTILKTTFKPQNLF